MDSWFISYCKNRPMTLKTAMKMRNFQSGRGRWIRSISMPTVTGSPIWRMLSFSAASSSIPPAINASFWSKMWAEISSATRDLAFLQRI